VDDGGYLGRETQTERKSEEEKNALDLSATTDHNENDHIYHAEI